MFNLGCKYIGIFVLFFELFQKSWKIAQLQCHWTEHLKMVNMVNFMLGVFYQFFLNVGKKSCVKNNSILTTVSVANKLEVVSDL